MELHSVMGALIVIAAILVGFMLAPLLFGTSTSSNGFLKVAGTAAAI
jgi:hypothetical protein